MDQPIACTLSAAEYAVRSEDTAALARRALRSREPIPDGTRLTFEAGAETERRLREIAPAGARCCAFRRMDRRGAENALVPAAPARAAAEPIIAELFA